VIHILGQFKYALKDISANKLSYSILCLQMIVVLLLTGFVSLQLINANNYNKSLEKLDGKQAYISIDKTTAEKISYLLNNEQESIEKMKELYLFMRNNSKTRYYTIISYLMPEKHNGRQVVEYIANEEFFDIFNQEVIAGRKFISKDFEIKNGTIPILVGYNLKDKYQLNNIYEITDSITGETQKYKVVGILKLNSSFVDLNNQQTNFTYFNDGYIRPLNENMIVTYNDFSVLDMVINNTVFISNNELDVNSIKNKSDELGLFSLEFITLDESLKIIKEREKQLIVYEIIILSIILIFSLMGIISALLEMVSKNMPEYYIHLKCGATHFLIISRIIIQISLVMIISYIPVIVIFKFSLATLYTFIFTLIIIFFTLIFPVWKLKNSDISDNLRKELQF